MEQRRSCLYCQSMQRGEKHSDAGRSKNVLRKQCSNDRNSLVFGTAAETGKNPL